MFCHPLGFHVFTVEWMNGLKGRAGKTYERKDLIVALPTTGKGLVRALNGS